MVETRSSARSTGKEEQNHDDLPVSGRRTRSRGDLGRNESKLKEAVPSNNQSKSNLSKKKSVSQAATDRSVPLKRKKESSKLKKKKKKSASSKRSKSKKTKKPKVPKITPSEDDPRFVLTPNGISSFSRDDTPDTIRLSIQGFFRYIVDGRWAEMTCLSGEELIQRSRPMNNPSKEIEYSMNHGYDIMLSDGTDTFAFVLHPGIQHLIETGVLYEGLILAINPKEHIVHKLSEGELSSEYFILAGFSEIACPVPGKIHVQNQAEICLQFRHPILYKDSFYLHFSADDCVSEVYVVDPGDETWPGHVEEGQPDKQVTGVILAKSKIVHFGKPGRIIHAPFNFSILLRALSSNPELNESAVFVTIWNKLSLKYFNDLSVGDIVTVSNFKTKKRAGRVELSLNERNPAGFLVTNGRDIETKELYPVRVSQVIHKPDHHSFDLVGVVVYAGKPFRELDRNLSRFHVARWVLIGDPDSITLLSVKVYTNSNPDAFNKLSAGILVCITNMTVVTMTKMRDSWTTRSFFCKTSNCSDIVYYTFFDEYVHLPDELEDKLYNFSSDVLDSIVTVNSFQGISYKRSNSMYSFKGLTFDHEPISLKQCSDLMDSLHVGQTKFILLQGRVRSISRMILVEADEVESAGERPLWSIEIEDLNQMLEQTIVADIVQNPLPYTQLEKNSQAPEHLDEFMAAFIQTVHTDLFGGMSQKLISKELKSAKQQLTFANSILAEHQLVFALSLSRSYASYTPGNVYEASTPPSPVQCTVFSVFDRELFAPLDQ